MAIRKGCHFFVCAIFSAYVNIICMNESGKTETPTSSDDGPRSNYHGSRRYRGPSSGIPDFFTEAASENNTVFQPRKNIKKIIIIALVIIIAIAAAIFITIFVLDSLRKSPANVEASLNNYLEYFIYGTESNNPELDLTLTRDKSDYAIREKSYQDENYGAKLLEKLDSIPDVIENSNKEFHREIIDTYLYVSKIVNTNYIIKSYEDYDGVTAINENNKRLNAASGDIEKTTLVLVDYYLKSRIKELEAYERFGCLKGHQIDSVCAEKIVVQEESLNTAKKFRAVARRLDYLYQQSVYSLISLRDSIKEKIK